MPRYDVRDIPQKDLHPWCHDAGGDVEGAVHAARLFLLEQLAAGAGEVEIIHGKGLGRLKNRIHELCEEYKHHQLILAYTLLGSNPGVTHIKLAKTRKAQGGAPEFAPSLLASKPFETLRAEFAGLLEAATPVSDQPEPEQGAPRIIQGEVRLGQQEFRTLEDYARALVRQERERAAPQHAAPRRLPKQEQRIAAPETRRIPLGGAGAGETLTYKRSELEDQAREARQPNAPPVSRRGKK